VAATADDEFARATRDGLAPPYSTTAFADARLDVPAEV
jgi:hypothetical protein